MESSTLPGARYLDLPYRIILTKDRRRGSDTWVAMVEELPECEARGTSAEEAVHSLREQMAGWISEALQAGRPVPRPRLSPGSPDGRLSVAIPQSLHEAITRAAVREGLTVEQYVTIGLAGVTRWQPGDQEVNARWVQSRGAKLVQGRPPDQPLRRALAFNAALLALVVVAALTILVIAVAHGF